MADTVNPTPTPVAVDYTSRDYYSLREDLILRVKDNLPAWSGEDPADFGVSMVEAFAYMGDVVNYYIDRVANESYLPTATQRQSILNIARNYGYTPAGYRASSLNVQFVSSSANQVVLPPGTELLATVTVGDRTFDLIFTVPTSTTVPGQIGETVGIAETVAFNYENVALRTENAAQSGTDIAGELVAVSTGQPDQSYRLSESQVIDGSARLFVQSGDFFEPWTQVDHITDYGPYDSVYTVTTDADDFTTVNFGDGVSGVIPNQFSVIKAVYDVGGGAVGNIAANLITEIYRVPGLTPSELSSLSTTIEVTNTSTGLGGQSPEDNESIKENAPKALTALNRAVSLKDFGALALQVPAVGKAKAVADYWSSVTMYVSPQRNVVSVDQFPGYSDNPSSGGVLLEEWNELQAEVELFMEDKLLIGTSLTVSPPTYVETSLEVTYTKFEQFQDVLLETAMLKAALDIFAYSETEFGQVVYPQEIEAELAKIPGIRSVNVVGLYRTAEDSSREILVGAANEIFVFLTDNIVISQLSSVATLTNLSATPGTFSPTFTPSFSNYSLVVPNGTTTVAVTATTQSAGAIMTIDGNVATSATPRNVTVTVGVKNIPISIKAADGITTQNYTLTITRNS